MPMSWSRDASPYRWNYFAILQVGAHASPRVIRAARTDLARKLSGGGEHRVAGRLVSEADLAEAESRLLDRSRWASEVLLVHHRPTADEGRLTELCAAVEAAATVEPSSRPFRLTELAALAPLLPRVRADDLPRPRWADLPVPGPDSPQDLRADVEFDR